MIDSKIVDDSFKIFTAEGEGLNFFGDLVMSLAVFFNGIGRKY